MQIKHSAFRRLPAVLILLCIWQIAAVKTDNAVLLPDVAGCTRALFENLGKDGFLQTIFFSMYRIGRGFLLAFVLGFVCAAAAFYSNIFRYLLQPMVGILKAIPVASFVVLLLIWYGSEALTFYISFLVVFPVIYENTLSGFCHADEKLLELAQVYECGWYQKWFYIYRNTVLSYLLAACKTCVGMAWKSGVAAELIGTPQFSIGEQLYQSKIMLETADVFSWTFVIILLSTLCEKMLLVLLGAWRKLQKPPAFPEFFISVCCKRKQNQKGEKTDGVAVKLSHIQKSYGEQKVLSDISLNLQEGKIYCLMGESGIGKTTLLRILAGLEPADNGTAEVLKPALVFQENRLCEQADALHNVAMLSKNPVNAELKEDLLKLLPEEVLGKPVESLSGGMKRRVCICAAMNSAYSLIFMDEPFNGLDEQTKKQTIRYIREKQQGRTLLFTTHQEKDAKLLAADEKIFLTKNNRCSIMNA